ncbi:hypothetical protein SISNIDRAFT_458249 [Sistotremastrum niveocremeum HHB9708]|uniref:Uncharacterized protein n=1 Tax=Sistotremastrum niveocremeum HHB9708 TaxID=1314777 RepID=A0A164QSS1_9AGAM|nr:hypothetical protein SISNIDRAFT_458249 [Sistotremastrum niveocremeum HHB9708]
MAIEPFLSTSPQRGFTGIVVFQAIVVLAMIATVFGLIVENVDVGDQVSKTVPCYFAIFGLAELFELYLTLDALYFRNIIEMFGILAFHGGMLVYSAIQIHETKNAVLHSAQCGSHCESLPALWSKVEKLLIVVPAILGASLLGLCFVARALYDEFGWAIFHHLGANPAMKRMYRWYQIMIILVKMDWFFFTGLTLQLLVVVLNRDSAEFGVTIAAIPVVMILLVGSAIALKREIKWLMAFSLLLFCASQAYFIFKFVRYYSPSTEAQYVSTRATLSVFTIISFLLVFASFAIGLRCFADFDKGLRQSKTNEAPQTRPKLGHSAPGSPMYEQNQSYGLQRQISIE